MKRNKLVEYRWEGIGKLSILSNGKGATIRFNPHMGLKRKRVYYGVDSVEYKNGEPVKEPNTLGYVVAEEHDSYFLINASQYLRAKRRCRNDGYQVIKFYSTKPVKVFGIGDKILLECRCEE